MGEAKRKKLLPVDEKALEMTKALAENGQLVMGGFAAWMIYNKIDANHAHFMRYADAYFTGAEHLWRSIFATFDPGAKETPADMKRLDDIQKELDVWRERKMREYAQEYLTKGSA